MSSEQKKFAPELMGGASLLDRIRNALSSILDIGKSARIRLSRITKPDYDVIKEILDICKETECKLRVLPGIYQLVSDTVTVKEMKDVSIEDLLGRDPIRAVRCP